MKANRGGQAGCTAPTVWVTDSLTYFAQSFLRPEWLAS